MRATWGMQITDPSRISLEIITVLQKLPEKVERPKNKNDSNKKIKKIGGAYQIILHWVLQYPERKY